MSGAEDIVVTYSAVSAVTRVLYFDPHAAIRAPGN